MVDLNALSDILSVRNGVWSVFLLCLVAVFRMHTIVPAVMEQLNRRRRDRADIEGDQYERMDARAQRLEQRCEELEAREIQCQHDLADAMRRIGELEGYMIGRGDAANAAQRMLSAERQQDAQRKKGAGDD